MDLQPLADIIVVKMLKIEPQKRGGLVLPEVDEEKQQIRWAEVVAIGLGSFSQGKGERIPIDVHIGDIVGINGHAPVIEYVEDEIKYLLVNAPYILCYRKSNRP